MPRRLEHAYSVTVDMDDERSVFQGHLRIVRSAKRARFLRKRGVEVDCYSNPMGIGGVASRFWAWFETDTSYEQRMLARGVRSRLRARIRKAQREHKLNWVDGLLTGLYWQTYGRARRPDPLKHDPATFVARWGNIEVELE